MHLLVYTIQCLYMSPSKEERKGKKKKNTIKRECGGMCSSVTELLLRMSGLVSIPSTTKEGEEEEEEEETDAMLKIKVAYSSKAPCSSFTPPYTSCQVHKGAKREMRLTFGSGCCLALSSVIIYGDPPVGPEQV